MSHTLLGFSSLTLLALPVIGFKVVAKAAPKPACYAWMSYLDLR